MRRRRNRLLVLAAAFFYFIALANDRLGLWVLAWLLISLLVVCWFLARLGANGLVITRRALPARLVAGQTLELAFELRNLGSLPRSGLLLTDRWANEIAGTQAEQSVLAPLLPGESSLEVSVETMPVARGRLQLGPVVINVGDPIGLFEVERPAAVSAAEVLVHPRLETLGGRLGVGGAGYEDTTRGAGASGLVLHSLREYQPGDDLRHIHWLASARRGQLLTREYERSSAVRALTLLDLDARQVFGRGPRSSLEVAISAAGSVLAWLGEQGRGAHLLAHEGALIDLTSGAGGLSREVLDALAVVTGRGQVALAALLAQQMDRLEPGSSLIAVTAGPDEALLSALLRLAAVDRQVWLILVDAAAYQARDPGPRPDWLLSVDAVRARLAGADVPLTVLGPDRGLADALAAGPEGAP